jgi:hypothetical protein
MLTGVRGMGGAKPRHQGPAGPLQTPTSTRFATPHARYAQGYKNPFRKTPHSEHSGRQGRLIGSSRYIWTFRIFPDMLAVSGPGRCLKSFLEAVRFISTHREPVANHGDPFRPPGHSTIIPMFPRNPKIRRNLPINSPSSLLHNSPTHLERCASKS